MTRKRMMQVAHRVTTIAATSAARPDTEHSRETCKKTLAGDGIVESKAIVHLLKEVNSLYM